MLHVFKNIYVYGYGYEGQLRNICVSTRGQVSIFEPNYSLESLNSASITDMHGHFTLMPGLTDTHLHGAAGYDFTDADEESLSIIAKGLAKCGLAYFVATLFSLELTQLKKSLASLDKYFIKQANDPQPGKANLLGIHLEGPFISKNCTGSHDENVLQNEINLTIFTDLISAAPHINEWKITLSPDIAGAIDFIHDLRKFIRQNPHFSTKVFIGHTNASEQLIQQAFTAGKGIVVGFTHAGNACMEKSHRKTETISPDEIQSNLVRWLIDKKNHSHSFIYEIIADGIHLSANFIQFLREECSSEKLMLVSDQLAPTGQADGEYNFGKHKILKKQGKCVLKENPQKLAGSVTSLPRMFETYGKLLQINKKPLMRELYTAAVLNPRLSSISHTLTLADEKNFVIVDSDNAKIAISACNGQLINYGIPEFNAISTLFVSKDHK